MISTLFNGSIAAYSSLPMQKNANYDFFNTIASKYGVSNDNDVNNPSLVFLEEKNQEEIPKNNTAYSISLNLLLEFNKMLQLEESDVNHSSYSFVKINKLLNFYMSAVKKENTAAFEKLKTVYEKLVLLNEKESRFSHSQGKKSKRKTRQAKEEKEALLTFIKEEAEKGKSPGKKTTVQKTVAGNKSIVAFNDIKTSENSKIISFNNSIVTVGKKENQPLYSASYPKYVSFLKQDLHEIPSKNLVTINKKISENYSLNRLNCYEGLDFGFLQPVFLSLKQKGNQEKTAQIVNLIADVEKAYKEQTIEIVLNSDREKIKQAVIDSGIEIEERALQNHNAMLSIVISYIKNANLKEMNNFYKTVFALLSFDEKKQQQKIFDSNKQVLLSAVKKQLADVSFASTPYMVNYDRRINRIALEKAGEEAQNNERISEILTEKQIVPEYRISLIKKEVRRRNAADTVLENRHFYKPLSDDDVKTGNTTAEVSSLYYKAIEILKGITKVSLYENNINNVDKNLLINMVSKTLTPISKTFVHNNIQMLIDREKPVVLSKLMNNGKQKVSEKGTLTVRGYKAENFQSNSHFVPYSNEIISELSLYQPLQEKKVFKLYETLHSREMDKIISDLSVFSEKEKINLRSYVNRSNNYYEKSLIVGEFNRLSQNAEKSRLSSNYFIDISNNKINGDNVEVFSLDKEKSRDRLTVISAPLKNTVKNLVNENPYNIFPQFDFKNESIKNSVEEIINKLQQDIEFISQKADTGANEKRKGEKSIKVLKEKFSSELKKAKDVSFNIINNESVSLKFKSDNIRNIAGTVEELVLKQIERKNSRLKSDEEKQELSEKIESLKANVLNFERLLKTEVYEKRNTSNSQTVFGRSINKFNSIFINPSFQGKNIVLIPKDVKSARNIRTGREQVSAFDSKTFIYNFAKNESSLVSDTERQIALLKKPDVNMEKRYSPAAGAIDRQMFVQKSDEIKNVVNVNENRFEDLSYAQGKKDKNKDVLTKVAEMNSDLKNQLKQSLEDTQNQIFRQNNDLSAKSNILKDIEERISNQESAIKKISKQQLSAGEMNLSSENVKTISRQVMKDIEKEVRQERQRFGMFG